jgi:biopolymer transport protein ExbD
MSRLRRKRKLENIAVEVSLTPLIDTALTLLIIFMVTTPMIHNAIRVNLPRGSAQENDNQVQEFVVTIDKESNMFFNDRPITLDTLGATIKDQLAQATGNSNKRVWIKIDKSNSCDTLIGAIDCIKVVGGIQDVAVLTQKTA